MTQASLFQIDPNEWADEVSASSLTDNAKSFCEEALHRRPPYSKRNWGGLLHSLCSYQGKLKPAIAHFLVRRFTRPGDRVLDPLAGVGTIPLEARRQGRIGIANDLSPLASTVSRAKLEPFAADQVAAVISSLTDAIESGPGLDRLMEGMDTEFGLNGPITGYYHQDTLRELLVARRFFMEQAQAHPSPAVAVVLASLLHILHGNRPYALSRRSHPVTPFAPTGPTEYRALIPRLATRLDRVVPALIDLASASPSGLALQSDFRELDISAVDAVITSPPFMKSLRFWSMNWLRLWFSGWEPPDFALKPEQYLESQQKKSLQAYSEFADAMARLLKPGGVLIMHLGETATVNMASELAPLLSERFEIAHIGRECVAGTESHGLSDKGSTIAHWYLFARTRTSTLVL